MAFEKYAKKVPGKKRGDILLFALSTCGWCRKTKKFFTEHQIPFEFTDYDLADAAAQDKILREL